MSQNIYLPVLKKESQHPKETQRLIAFPITYWPTISFLPCYAYYPCPCVALPNTNCLQPQIPINDKIQHQFADSVFKVTYPCIYNYFPRNQQPHYPPLYHSYPIHAYSHPLNSPVQSFSQSMYYNNISSNLFETKHLLVNTNPVDCPSTCKNNNGLSVKPIESYSQLFEPKINYPVIQVPSKNRDPYLSIELPEELFIEFDSTNSTFMQLLIKLFSSTEVKESDCTLSISEERILDAIIVRKFSYKIKKNQIQLKKTSRPILLNQIFSLVTVGKSKDCHKMILCRLFHSLKRKFFNKSKFSSENLLEFYKYYFHDVSVVLELPISQFFYPYERSNKFINHFRKISVNLNFKYCALILQSDLFLKDTHIFLSEIRNEHLKDLPVKLKKLMAKWDSEKKDSNKVNANSEQPLIDYLLKNNRCKMPFTLKEVEHSSSLFLSRIEKIEDQIF